MVRFSLQDVKKQIQRRGGDLYVSLHFLRPAELQDEIERLVAFHERHIGLQHRQFSIDEARAIVADYRLANCLLATLSSWYVWQQPDWKETLLRPGNDTLARLEEAGITSPIYLRLALYNYINEHYGGFLDGQRRGEVLQTFAAFHGLSIVDLEYLLALDSEAEAVLVRETASAPSVQEVASLYNQWTFEAALFNASDVHFAIDCQAFLQAQNVENPSHAPVAGIGSVIKRLCYLARKLGVYYDLAYDAGQTVAPVPKKTAGERSFENHAAILHLTLYGPQEMTGAPQQYGLRLARLCRMILGYGSSRLSSQAVANSSPVSSSRGRPKLIGAIREAEATVHFLQRSYRFAINADLLKLLPSDTISAATASHSIPAGASAERGGADTNPSRPVLADRSPAIFDSSIEQAFAEAFTALANSQAVDGWQLEREPEPLLLPSPAGEGAPQSIFIPDFALTRGKRRIYVEILGFWTPSYRERKVARLQQLKGRDDLVLAIPVEARAAFAAIAEYFPIVEYNGQLSATELLQALRSRYDDVEERLAGIDLEVVRERVMQEGLVPERACYQLLHCYRRSELQRAAQLVLTATIAFTMGIGLYTASWLEHLQASFVDWVGSVAQEQSARKISLREAAQFCRLQSPILEQCEDAVIEALIGLWPQVQVSRSSIFDTAIHLANDAEVGFPTEQQTEDDAGGTFAAPSPRKQLREGRATYRKGNQQGRSLANKGPSLANKSRSSANETVQDDLWG